MDSPLLLNDFFFPALKVTQMCPSEQSLPSSERKVISTRRVRADVNLTLDILLSNVQTVACPTHGTNKSLNVSDTDGTVRRSVGQQTDRQFTVTSPLQMAPTDVSHWMAPSDILSVKKQPTDSRPPPLDVSAPSTSTGSRSQLTATSPSLPVSLSPDEETFRMLRSHVPPHGYR